MRDWLVEKREQAGLTQKQVAENASIERAYYNMIEKGTRTPSVPVAKEIAKVLAFDWPIFFEDDGNDSTHKEMPR